MNLRSLILACLLFHFSVLSAQGTSGEPDLEATTATGIHIAVFSALTPIEINKIHSWNLIVTDNQNQAVDDAVITVTGGMPDHDHGLPTQPQVTEQTGPGTYLLEGVRFHMPGRWQILVEIETAAQTSDATIEFNL